MEDFHKSCQCPCCKYGTDGHKWKNTGKNKIEMNPIQNHEIGKNFKKTLKNSKNKYLLCKIRLITMDSQVSVLHKPHY